MDYSPTSDQTSLQTHLQLQKKAYLAAPIPSIAERRADLLTLKRFVVENQEAICAALNADYGNRSRHETLLLEIFPVVTGIDHALKHLKQWMRPQRRGMDRLLFGIARNRVVPQPLGVVGVIVPWNFPINLSLLPLTYIFAAGNRAMVKMSENSRHLAQFMIATLPAYFPPEKLAIFDETGGVGVAFSALPFDHLLFTGSGQTGRAVMAAAAKNLCPVTLELGGKSPAVVLPDYPLNTAVERIMYVKMLNAGQICTTVDTLWLPPENIASFVAQAKVFAAKSYATLDTKDYTSIIDARSFSRITAAMEEAQARGATLVPLLDGPAWDETTHRITPHIVLNAPADCSLMQREIFGPVLPIRSFTSIDEVITSIQSGPRPLAIYPFSNDTKAVQNILDRVISGGVSVNDALFHVGQHDLPFGGVGDSGMGHYHGKEGFETFSKLRPVFYQSRFSGAAMLRPPYGKLAERFLAFLIR